VVDSLKKKKEPGGLVQTDKTADLYKTLRKNKESKWQKKNTMKPMP
jgi:hypothetical protein